MRNKSVQELADLAGLSRVTVWKVLNNRPGVAPDTVRRVREALESITPSFPEIRGGKNVALVASRTDTSVFWTRIVDQIASLLNQAQISMSYYPLEIMEMTPATLATTLQTDKNDGLLVLNVYNAETLRVLTEKKLPSVYLDAVPGYHADMLHGDLLLLEGELTIRSITENLIRSGITQIGFIGDVSYAISNQLRYRGFESAMREHRLEVNPDFCLTTLSDKYSYRETIQRYISGLSNLPEAFVCVNDYIAFLAHNLLADRGGTLPVLTGYDNSGEFMLDHYGITTVQVQNDMIGKRMVRQLLFRMENPKADPEEITIVPRIIFRGGGAE